MTKLGQCNIRSTKHVLVEISNFFDPPNIFCTKPNGARARSLRSTSASSIYSINISGRESALAAKHERVVHTLEPERARSAAEHERAPGVAEVIRDCEERARCEARARLMVDCWDAGDVRTRRASCVLGWPKKVAWKSDCCI